MNLSNRYSDKTPGFCAEIPDAFSSLEEACNSMDYHWNACIHLINDLEADPGYEQFGIAETIHDKRHMTSSEYMNKWAIAFQVFLDANRHTLDRTAIQAAHSLELSQTFCKVFLDITARRVLGNECAWDALIPAYERAVELASLIVEPSSSDDENAKQGPVFSLDRNIVAPMYATAHRCRDPVIRRKAVSILYAASRQEGVWNSLLTARVAERLIHIEEEGIGPITCAEDVPEWSRIPDVEVKFDQYSRVATIHYTRSHGSMEGCKTLMEIIEW